MQSVPSPTSIPSTACGRYRFLDAIVTLEISNTTPLPAKVYSNEGISQVLFFQSDEVCEVSYADKKGKYQG
jgi:deoxycytidine triphosphate deaminase